MVKEKITDKIKKLLSLADSNKNASEEEVKAALLKAQELMAKYDVYVEIGEDEKIEYNIELCEHKWDMGFRTPLSIAIANNFRCETFFRGKSVCFMGRKEDATIARSVFEAAYSFILREGNRHYNREYQLGFQTKGVFNSYALGFIRGIEQAFGEQCVALMIVTPPDVKDKFKEMSEGWRTKNVNFGAKEIHGDIYRAGEKDGKAMVQKKRITT